VEILQHGGRVGRRDGDLGLFVIFYEPWVGNICLEDFKYGEADDPDRPCSFLKPTSQVRDRITYSSVALIQSKCLQKFFASYLNDDSPYGIWFSQITT
jgi:hypothetical protein